MNNLRNKIEESPYVLMLLIIILATFLQFFANDLLGSDYTNALLIYVMVPLIISWFGGFYMGVLSTIVSMLVADYFFYEPLGSVLQTPREVGRMTVFLLQGVIISMLNDMRNKSDQRLLKAYKKEKKARFEAEEAKKERDDFISMVSHELKNPMTSQKAFLQILKKSAIRQKNTTFMKYLEKVDNQTNKMSRLIEDLLSVSKLRVGKLQLVISHIDISDCVKQVVEEFEASDIKQRIIVKGTISKPVLADKDRVMQVITNLLSNAIKYSDNSKKVSITLSESSKFASISVKDYGMGISKKDQTLIFSKYYRAKEDKRKYKGFGMGLFIVSKIVKLHNGKISLKSDVGKGSTFTIKLPVAQKKTS